MTGFLERLREEVLFSDGATGTFLQQLGIRYSCSAEVVLTNPGALEKLHESYAKTGSRVLNTCTYSANRHCLEKHGLESKTRQINEQAVRIAKKSGAEFVMGEIGPLNDYLAPLGSITFDQAHEYFAEQARALSAADVIGIHTFADTKMLRAALIAVRENTKLPIVASGTFEDDGKTVLGTNVETFATIAEACGADVVGANCTLGPKEMLPIAEAFTKHTSLPISILSNGGMPKIKEGKPVWEVTPEEFAAYSKKMVESGVSNIGGCCGTTPEHIRAMMAAIGLTRPKPRNVLNKTRFCSRTKTISFDDFVIVGERINPSSRKKMKDELLAGKIDTVKQEAIAQVGEGAGMLDVNVSIVGADEEANLVAAVNAVQRITDAAIFIDTTSIKALEAALKSCEGKPVINSVNGEEKNLATKLPLAKKYGAGIIALAIDEHGVPKTAEQRTKIAERIISRALENGLKKEDVIVDCVTVPIALDPANEKEILGAVRQMSVKSRKTILGISNISHGLPEQGKINNEFLKKAQKAGLSAAIMNPLDLLESGEAKTVFEKKILDYKHMPLEQQLHSAIVYGDEENIARIVNTALETKNALEVNDILIKALNEVGTKYEAKVFFLPHLLSSAKAMTAAFERLRQEFKKSGEKNAGRVVMATVKDDIHDIGKNIVAALLESYNYEVVDLGTDVSAERIIEAAQREKPQVIALSALMTTTAVGMGEIIKKLRSNNISAPVIIGGAVVNEDFAKSIGAFYAPNGLSAVRKIGEIANAVS